MTRIRSRFCIRDDLQDVVGNKKKKGSELLELRDNN